MIYRCQSTNYEVPSGHNRFYVLNKKKILTTCSLMNCGPYCSLGCTFSELLPNFSYIDRRLCLAHWYTRNLLVIITIITSLFSFLFSYEGGSVICLFIVLLSKNFHKQLLTILITSWFLKLETLSSYGGYLLRLHQL